MRIGIGVTHEVLGKLGVVRRPGVTIVLVPTFVAIALRGEVLQFQVGIAGTRRQARTAPMRSSTGTRGCSSSFSKELHGSWTPVVTG